MSHKLLTPLLVLFFLTTMPISAPPAHSQTPASTIDPGRIGMVIRDPWYDLGNDLNDPTYLDTVAQDRMGAILASAGVRWVRLEFIINEQVGSVEANLTRYDYFINTVAPRYGLKILGLLAFGLITNADPRDATYGMVAPYQSSSHPLYGFGVNTYIITWLDRALLIANRYQQRIHAYELLNEQNRLPPVASTPGQSGFAGGEGVSPTITASLHTKFYRLFRENRCRYAPTLEPSWRDAIDIIIGGLHPRGSSSYIALGGQISTPPDMSDGAYLEALFTSSAFRGYQGGSCARYPTDGIGYHPYPVEIVGVATLADVSEELARMTVRINLLRARLSAIDAQAGASPFWITEIGYNVAYSNQNMSGQALFLRETFTTLGSRSDVAVIFWFKYEDFPPADGTNAQRWGIVRIPFQEDPRCPGGACYARGGEPILFRPSYMALREVAGLPIYQIHMPLVARNLP